jgi:hypothetical protein
VCWKRLGVLCQPLKIYIFFSQDGLGYEQVPQKTSHKDYTIPSVQTIPRLKIEHMESTHEESHGLGAGHSTLSSLTQMLLNRLSLYMIVSDYLNI